MDIKVALHAGFCFGVDRAVKTVYKEIEKNPGKIYTYGPIIHNNDVVKALESHGVSVISQIKDGADNTVIIRAHGVGADIYEQAKKHNVTLIDSTCPYVQKVQRFVSDHYHRDYNIVIVGKEAHPEVQGVLGWCEFKGTCVNTLEEAKAYQNRDKVLVVAQTTITKELWENASEVIEKNNTNVTVINTICKATVDRQEAAIQLAREVDCMIVIGSFHSSNTKKLVEICQKYCKKTIQIENSEKFMVTQVEKCGIIGITAGASTPVEIIEKIIFKINEGEVQVNG